MPELTLVRHASTLLNQQRRYQGHVDVPLSERGRAEAERLGARLATVPFDRVLCSDLRRCRETAALARPGARMEVDARLRELDFGAWDGLTFQQCRARDTRLLESWIADPTHHTPPGGEAWGDFCARVDAVVDALPREGAVLVVAHGGPIRRIVSRALGIGWQEVARMEFSACGITRLSLLPDGGYLRCGNDTAHLEASWPR